MKKLLCLFKVGSLTNFGNNNVEANLSPVCTGDGNKSFSIYTPSGSIKIHITNPDALDFFNPGDEYFIEFTKSEKSNTAVTWGNAGD